MLALFGLVPGFPGNPIGSIGILAPGVPLKGTQGYQKGYFRGVLGVVLG